MTEKYPGYTSHGHPIPGADGIAGQRPKYVARCGGPRLCGTCSLEAERYNEPPTMTDQTPSTEDVRYGYRTGVTAPILPVEASDAFDAWLAAHDREVAAKALREAAASARDNELNDDGTGYFNWLPKEWNLLASEWLNSRAARIEQEARS